VHCQNTASECTICRGENRVTPVCDCKPNFSVIPDRVDYSCYSDIVNTN
jgi:hypothetical protein